MAFMLAARIADVLQRDILFQKAISAVRNVSKYCLLHMNTLLLALLRNMAFVAPVERVESRKMDKSSANIRLMGL